MVRIDIGRASKTIESIMVSGNLDHEPIAGHPEFTIWVAPSQENCTLRKGVEFKSNSPDCTFTVEDGPGFLVGKVLALNEINGTLYYAWDEVCDAEKVFNFVGISEPRCLDLSWYFRIFETGVMLGYPNGLTRIEEIGTGGSDCVVLFQSNTTEYTTSP